MNNDAILEQAQFEVGAVIDLLKTVETDGCCYNQLDDILNDLRLVDDSLATLRYRIKEAKSCLEN